MRTSDLISLYRTYQRFLRKNLYPFHWGLSWLAVPYRALCPSLILGYGT